MSRRWHDQPAASRRESDCAAAADVGRRRCGAEAGVLLVAVFIALVPTIFMIMTALKSDDEYTFNKVGVPRMPWSSTISTWVLFESPFFAWMLNSAILAGGSVLLSSAVSCLGAYAIARWSSKGGTCCSRSRWR